MGIVFAIWRRDLIAWGICWAWAASAMCDGARYIYDAPRGELMLMGASDGLGDWSKILGPEHFDKLYLADRLSAQVRTIGIITWFAAVSLIVFALVRNIMEAAAPRQPNGSARPPNPRASSPVGDVDMWRR